MNFEQPARHALKWTAVVAAIMVLTIGTLYVVASITLFFLIFAISFAVFALNSDTIGLANTTYRQVLQSEYAQVVLRKVHQITGDNIVQEFPNRGNTPR